MKEVTATEAARTFTRILDEAEAGEEFLVTRKGVCVAKIVPAPRSNGEALKLLASRWAGNIGLDDTFRDAVEAIDDYAVAMEEDRQWQS